MLRNSACGPALGGRQETVGSPGNPSKSIRNHILVKSLTILKISLLAKLFKIDHFPNKNKIVFGNNMRVMFVLLPMFVDYVRGSY